MDKPHPPSQLEPPGKDLGLDLASAAELVEHLKESEPAQLVRRLDAQREEALQLQHQLATLQGENQKMGAKLQEIAGLIGCQRPERLIHDLRNVLNELVLLRAALNADEPI